MSPITSARRGWQWIRAARRPSGWREADACALAVADVPSVHVRPDSVRAAVTRARARYGGPEGVRQELSARLAGDPRQSAHAAATLEWARRTVREVDQC